MTKRSVQKTDDWTVAEGVSEIRFCVEDSAGQVGVALTPRVVLNGRVRGFGTDATIGDEDRYAAASDCVLRLNDGTRVLISARIIEWGDGSRR